MSAFSVKIVALTFKLSQLFEWRKLKLYNHSYYFSKEENGGTLNFCKDDENGFRGHAHKYLLPSSYQGLYFGKGMERAHRGGELRKELTRV